MRFLSNCDLIDYGNKEAFERRLQEGYAEVAFGMGRRGRSDLCLFAFYHPNGTIATYEHPATMPFWSGLVKQGTIEKEYNGEGFQRLTDSYGIEMSVRVNLEDTVNNWEILTKKSILEETPKPK